MEVIPSSRIELLAEMEERCVRVETPGGGGFGDPKSRDPSAVARDLANGKVSAEWVKEARRG